MTRDSTEPVQLVASAFWRRLDTPGHDACRVFRIADGLQLEGSAVFRHDGGAACIHYAVTCDADWRSRSGRVRGWIGDRDWDLRIDRAASGAWLLNDVAATVPGLERCEDLDFGFTPATNLLQLRRSSLKIGGTAAVPAAWVDLPDAKLSFLPQRYRRDGEATYWYESPTASYEAQLEIASSGFVRVYPGLWVLET